MAESTRFEEKEYATGFNPGLWKDIFGYTKALWPFGVLLATIMTAVAIVDGLFPLMTRQAVDSIVPEIMEKGSSDRVIPFIVRFCLLAFVQGFNVWFMIVIAGIIEVRVVHILRARAFSRLQKLSFSYYDKTPAGWILSRMTSDAQKLGDTIAWGIVDLVWGCAMMCAITGFMLWMNVRLALICLSFTPVLLVLTFYFQRKILIAQRKTRKANSALSGLFNEGLQGARTTKTLVTEIETNREFFHRSSDLRSHAIRAAKLSALYIPCVILLSSSGAALALGFGGHFVIQGLVSIGTLIAFINYTMMLFDPAREVARVLSEFQAAQASAERLLSLVTTQPDIVDRERALDEEPLTGSVEFADVSFHYGDGSRIFDGFSLNIPAGQLLAIVGETGSGKSTLVNLLCRFYEPVNGSILIDGRDYREYTQHWLHSRLGYVLQTPLLFTGTIRENIRYGRLDATDLEVERAAREVRAHEFIVGLEGGYDAAVGEGGVLLSTGQKQLISLARALLAKPAIMVLDEATSSIDTETEVLIQYAIERLLTGCTSIVIAHRLSTIRSADRIIVLDKGRIIEDGSHEQLMSLKGSYYRLYSRQFIEEAVKKLC